MDQADQLVAEQKVNEAILFYQRCIQGNPKEPVFYLNQAALLMGQKRYVLAERDYNAALGLSFESFWPYIGLARIYAAQDNFEDVKDVLLEGLKKIPNNSVLLFYLGKTYYVTGEGDLALQYLNQALNANFAEPLRIYYYRGVVYQDLFKDSAKAAAEFKLYFSLNDANNVRREDVEKRVKEMSIF